MLWNWERGRLKSKNNSIALFGLVVERQVLGLSNGLEVGLLMRRCALPTDGGHDVYW